MKKTPKPLLSDVDKILAGKSYPLELVTTKLGGMKAAFQQNIFESHFNRNGVKFWRCGHHRNGCPAKIVSKDSLVWPYNLKHNHDIEPIVFVPTQHIIEENPTAVTDALSADNSVGGSGGSVDLKLRLKERFAAIGRKLQKN